MMTADRRDHTTKCENQGEDFHQRSQSNDRSPKKVNLTIRLGGIPVSSGGPQLVGKAPESERFAIDVAGRFVSKEHSCGQHVGSGSTIYVNLLVHGLVVAELEPEHDSVFALEEYGCDGVNDGTRL